ncbi:hypothetical protein UFOVP862_15 [uncultured Caudovirales phage]|uniref:Uncharacterized protein n=1 Tax=uncultured Caudovirales phage TaxID=2100421 RepID=A0A6J5P8Q5_9CAUD|nr:hypothetical protein UFOVP862_15 [uncultured Caudovirales phage]
MALISGYGGAITFSGFTASTGITIQIKSFTLNIEKDSLEVTAIGDWRKKYAPGRTRVSGSLTLFRQTVGTDDTLRAHLMPTTLLLSVGAVLTLKYVDQGNITYQNTMDGTAAVWNVQITSASFSDDGTGAGTWELSWEQQ